MRRTKVACFQAKLMVSRLSGKQKLILVSVHIAMNELCCPRWLWRGLRGRSKIEKLLVNPSHKIWNSREGENHEEMGFRSDGGFHRSGHNGAKSRNRAAQAGPDHYAASRREGTF